jgi:DNA-binding FadR family transcriptional regulator
MTDLSAQRPAARPRRNLTQMVMADLRERIGGGRLKPGDKLPTEQALIQELGVSRTVVREAIAGLRADGLVEPRQGIGVFVREAARPASGLSLLSEDAGKISSVIETLELRAAVEIEAAGLAAERRSPAQEAKIRECYDEIASAIARGEAAEDADFAFHRAIAEATNNRHFGEFFEFLGRRTIPRSQLSDRGASPVRTPAYVRQLQGEHETIMTAICRGDAEAAREAMRVHLKGSLERYQRLRREAR